LKNNFSKESIDEIPNNNIDKNSLNVIENGLIHNKSNYHENKLYETDNSLNGIN